MRDGRRFVLVPVEQYRKLQRAKTVGRPKAAEDEPPMPPRNPDGTFPAVLAARVSIARTIIRRRQAVKLSQRALALAAGIRPETLNRIEKARVLPDTSTIAKLDAALNKAERAATPREARSR